VIVGWERPQTQKDEDGERGCALNYNNYLALPQSPILGSGHSRRSQSHLRKTILLTSIYPSLAHIHWLEIKLLGKNSLSPMGSAPPPHFFHLHKISGPHALSATLTCLMANSASYLWSGWARII
jgi:hypothetical protein